MIKHNSPTVGTEESSAVRDVIQSGWLAQGEVTKKFEVKFSTFLGLETKKSVALCNGTSALYLALKSLEVKPGDEVIIPTYTCSALLNAIFMAKAIPIPVDINPIDFNISVDQIKTNKTPQTKAIIVPHTFGIPANIVDIKKLGIPVVEDCATSIGAKIRNKKTGTFGDAAIFSFFATKFITTGQGGMLVSNNSKIINRARDYLKFDLRKTYYPRFNLQITDIQSAMGIEQIKKIKSFLEKRQIMAREYIALCKEKGWDFQKPINKYYEPNWYRFVLKISHHQVTALKKYLYQKGISTIVPIEKWELLNVYLKTNLKKFPVANKICGETLSLPIYPKLLESNDFNTIMKALKNY